MRGLGRTQRTEIPDGEVGLGPTFASAPLWFQDSPGASPFSSCRLSVSEDASRLAQGQSLPSTAVGPDAQKVGCGSLWPMGSNSQGHIRRWRGGWMTPFPVLSSMNSVEGASLLVSAFTRITFLPKMHCSLLFAHLPASHLLQQVLGIFPSPCPYLPYS